MLARLSILGLALALVPFVCAGFDPSSSSNIAVYWGKTWLQAVSNAIQSVADC